jgi:exosortase D (VPLPA-CTERM-specific)
MSVQTITASSRSNAALVGLLITAAVVVAFFAFSDGLSELVTRWIRQEEYSHGFLIPVVSAWLLWTRRESVLASVGRPSWSGPAIILLALIMLVVGEYGSLFLLSQLGFILVLIGLVLATGGYSLLKATFVPIAFLIFAIPLPYFIESKLTLQLQLVSSQLGVDVIRLFRIPVYLEGNIIDLGYYRLAVIEACSGLRYLYPLLSLSFLAAYLFQAPLWQRLLVFVSAVPITIGMNGLRIGMVGVTVDRWGTAMAEGVLHFFEGWVIFIACAAILIAEIFLLARFSGRKFSQVFHVPVGSRKSMEPADSSGRLALVSCCLILVGVAGLSAHALSHRPPFIAERTRFATFPMMIGEWQGRASQLDAATERYLGLDDYLLADYVQQKGKPVNFYVAYYSSQQNGYAPHSPTVCLPGGGWLITRSEQTSYSGLGTALPLNRVILDHDGSKELVYYWFDERGRKIADEYWAKWYLLVDAITKNRSDGSLIRLVTQIFPGETEHDADLRLQSFMRDVVPTLGPYLPAEPGTLARSAMAPASDRGKAGLGSESRVRVIGSHSFTDNWS